MRAPRRPLACAALALAAACAPPERPAPPAFRRLALEGSGGEPTASVSRAHVRPDVDPERWHLGPEVERGTLAAPDGSPLACVRVPSEKSARVRVDGPFGGSAAAFNQVALTVALEAREDLRVAFLRAGERAFGTEALRVKGDGAPQTVLFDLGRAAREREPLDALEVEVGGLKGEVAVLGLALLWKPRAAWLPPAEAPDLVDLGGDARRAVGLASGTARLSSEPFEGFAGGVLRLAFGVPDELARPGARPSVRVRLWDAGAAEPSREERVELGRPGQWRPLEIPLDDRAGRSLRVELRLEDADDGPPLACAVAVPVVARRAANAPSVLLVTSDTHRADHLGTAPHGAGVETPFLDALAARGLYFVDCFASIEVTNPSHATLLTGVPPRDTGVLTNDHRLGERANTLAEAFQRAGYATLAAVSVRHLRHEQSGLGQGFDRVSSPLVGQRDSSETIAALEPWLAEHEGLPLFCWLHVFDAHDPYEPPEAFGARYWPEGRDPYDPALPAPPPKHAPRWDPEVRDLDWPVALYKGEVSYLDDQLRRFVEGSRFERGWIAVTADHGESLTAHDVYFAHLELYPDTLAVPLVLAGPGVPAARSERPVRQLDVGRTLLDLAGLRDSAFPGTDLVESREAPPEPRFALGTYGVSAAVEHQGWLLILCLRAHERGGLVPVERHQTELYDLRTDPGCLDDRVDAEPERAKRLRRALTDWLADASDAPLSSPAGSQSASDREQLVAMGYATGVETGAARELFDPECECAWCARFR